MKKTYVIWAMLVAIAFSPFGTTAGIAQSSYPNATAIKPTKTTAAQDIKLMAKEPNQVLAAAYQVSMGAFADALNGQTVAGGPVDVDFARAAVVEMRRGFDQMKKCNEAYMETISAEVRAKSTTTMQDLETHRADLNKQLTALEEEVKLSKPDAKKIATIAASVSSHLDAMTLVSRNGQPAGMTMKN